MVDHTQEQEKVRLALRSLHAELTQTNAALVPLIPIHQANIDTLRSDPLDFEVGVSFRLGGVSTEAWTTAQQTRAVALMDYDVVAPISRAYAQTKDLEFMRRKSYDLTFDGTEYLGFDPERLGDLGIPQRLRHHRTRTPPAIRAGDRGHRRTNALPGTPPGF